MDGAVQQWALEQKQAAGATVTLSNIKPYIKLDSGSNIPGCPANGTYAVTTVSVSPTCSQSTATPAHKLP